MYFTALHLSSSIARRTSINKIMLGLISNTSKVIDKIKYCLIYTRHNSLLALKLFQGRKPHLANFLAVFVMTRLPVISLTILGAIDHNLTLSTEF